MSSSERRSGILQAAGRLFEHYGVGKTTMQDVAREARVGVGTVYLEFASKEAIVQELSLSTHVGVLDAMRAAALRDRDPADRLIAVLMTRTDCFLGLRRKGHHACELIHCETGGVRAAHERFREEERSFLTTIIEEGRGSGRFRKLEQVDAARAAALVQRAFVSLSPPWILDADAEALRAAADLCQILIRGLVSPRPATSSDAKAGAPDDRPPARERSRRSTG